MYQLPYNTELACIAVCGTTPMCQSSLTTAKHGVNADCPALFYAARSSHTSV